MSENSQIHDLFKMSNLLLLIGFTVIAVVAGFEAIVMGWELWALIFVAFGVVISWIAYFRHWGSDATRLWICAAMIMGTYFYCSIHTSALFEPAIVIAVFLAMFTMTGMKGLTVLCQLTFIFSTAYYVATQIYAGMETEEIVNLIARSLVLIALISLQAYFSRMIISKWTDVINESQKEIEDLKESTRRLNDFLANVSHEIRTPVNAVIGLTGVCIEKETNEEIKNDMSAVRSAGRKVAEQIGDILDYSELDRGRLVLNNEDYMISSLIHDLVTELREYRKEGVELVINISPDIPAVMNTDVAKLKKIIRSLVSNGLKYTKEGGVYLRVDAEKHAYGVNLRIEVTDTGIGMTPEQLENAYETFYQADSSRSRSSSGLGLGLGIVAGFVEMLGGFMTIRSKVDVGTTVKVSIPQRVVDGSGCMSLADPGSLSVGAYLHFDKYSNPMVREYYNEAVVNIVKGLGIHMNRVDNIGSLRTLVDKVDLTHLFVAEEEYDSDPDFIESLTRRMIVTVVSNPDTKFPAGSRVKVMEKPFYCFPVVSTLNSKFRGDSESDLHMVVRDVHALVVDDEPMNLVVAKSIFNRYGMKVSTANSGMESVEMCRKEKYDIIFMDHMMSGMDGVEALKKIRSDVTGLDHDVPVVALTANAMSSAKKMFADEGFDGFVSKPIETEELERVLRRVLPKTAISFVKNEEEYEHFLNNQDYEVVEKVDTDSPVTFKESLKLAGVDVETGLHYCAGDVEFYKTLLEQISSEAEGKINKLCSDFHNKDWKDYEILIHATKSTSKTIGALAVSNDALSLEQAAKSKNAEYIEKNHDRFIVTYRELIRSLNAALAIDAPAEMKPEEEVDVQSDEVFEFNPDEEGENNNTQSDDVMEFSPDEKGENKNDQDDEVFEFSPDEEV
ncbi:MAG: response regulator [Lachnospiraceae bacterium]|nr:response regulator [Lachnospiraceae bacterium]